MILNLKTAKALGLNIPNTLIGAPTRYRIGCQRLLASSATSIKGNSMNRPLDRRCLVKTAGVMALATAAGTLRGDRLRAAGASGPGTEAPKLKAPANACDCHMHIYDGKYPVAANATLKPADALVTDYKLLQKRIGTSRNVIVTPSTYGTDNRVTLDAMAQIGPTARGVAVVDTTVTDAELKRMNDLGVRGIRFNLVQVGATTTEMIEPLSKRVNDLGWHIQIHMKGEQIGQSRICCCACRHRSYSITWPARNAPSGESGLQTMAS